MPVVVNVIFSLAISFAFVYAVIPGIIKAARARKLFDVPNTRSAAKKVVPTLGGIAIYAGFVLGVIISSDRVSINDLKYLLAAVTVMFIIGLNDDILGASVSRKFVIELLMALYLVIMGNFRFDDLHGIFGIGEIGYFAGTVLSLFAIIGIVNAVNLIDGIDGLASGVGIIVSLVYGFWFLAIGDTIYALTCFSLAGSLSAFFLYNVFGKTNKIFMGDTGSLVVGTILAVVTIHFNVSPNTPAAFSHCLPAISLSVMIVPVVDTLRVFALRILSKKSPFSPDMNHLHHNLLRLTGNHLKSTLILLVSNLLFIFVTFNLINVAGNNILFFLLLFSGLLLAELPAWVLRLRGKTGLRRGYNRSVLEFLFIKKKAG